MHYKEMRLLFVKIMKHEKADTVIDTTPID